MCGRFTLATELEHLQVRFAFDAGELSYTPSYNIAPGQHVMAIINSKGENRAGFLRWGLVPSWAKDPRIGHRLINARVETVTQKPSYRQALRKRRCLVLADGFYEWRKSGCTSQPMYIGRHDRQPFAFAGLWDTWRDPSGTPLYTCTILTTEANLPLRPIHHRMPVILHPEAERIWLDRTITAPEQLVTLLQSCENARLESHAVAHLVNSPRNNSPACTTAITEKAKDHEARPT